MEKVNAPVIKMIPFTEMTMILMVMERMKMIFHILRKNNNKMKSNIEIG